MPKHVEKTIKAKVHQPTNQKRQRLNHLHQEWNQNVDLYNDDASYQERRNQIDLNSGLVQDAKQVDSNEDNTHPVYLRSQLFKVEETGNDLADYFAEIPIEPYERIWLPLKMADKHRRELKQGEIRDSLLVKKGYEFYLNLSVRFESDTEIPSDPTFVGVDVGERNALTSVALKNGSPTKAEFWTGSEYKRINKKYGDMRSRLQQRESDKTLEEIKGEQSRKLEDLRHKQSRELVDYALQFSDPVIVLEDLTGIRDDIDYGPVMNRRLHSWGFRSLQEKIEYKAKEQGIPVVYVDPRKTSKKCHNCLHEGNRQGNRFSCTNSHCPVSEYNADLNGAVNIARRGAFYLCENTGLGKDRYDDRQMDGARLTVLQPRTPTNLHHDPGEGEVVAG